MTTRTLFSLFVIIFAVQTGHYAEHLTQMIQIYALHTTPPLARGLLGSVFDFEWVHFVYNLGLEIALAALWLGYRSIWQADASITLNRGIRLLAATAVFQGYHSIEHITKIYQYLFIPVYQSGLFPPPGILPDQTGWPIFLVHFWLNTIVWVAMVVVLWHLRPTTVVQVARAI